MIKRILYYAIYVLGTFSYVDNVVGYDDKVTHPEISKTAVRSSKLDEYLKTNLGFRDGIQTKVPSNSNDDVLFLLRKGSTDEDNPICRATNHFHNPLKTWDRAGISTIWWPLCPTWDVTSNSTRHSALTWATGYNSYNGSIINRSNQQMGWDKAREYFYAALTSNNKTTREDYFARTFQSVGQVMHLLQDMAVPAHVRNDFWNSHVWTGGANPYELYAKLNTIKISNLTKPQIDSAMPTFANPRQTDFWDTSDNSVSVPPQISNPALQSSAGLAEYTNANFVSEGTLFSNSTEFAYPRKSSTGEVIYTISDPFSPGRTVKRPYYYKTQDWEVGYHLAGVNYSNFYDSQSPPPYPPLDDLVHKDYADRLLPRAVGYSAGLLNYFFRGELVVRSANGGIKVKNLGTETMMSYTDPMAGRVVGNIEVYYDAMIDNTTIPPTIERRLLRSCPLSTTGCWQTPPNQLAQNQETALISFATPADNIISKRYIVVFHGKLGNEEGAVIGKIALPMMYYMKKVNGLDTIYKVDTDGNSDTVVYENTDRDSIGKISVSPDGNTLAFAGGSVIKLLDLATSPTSTPAVLTSGDWPDWSPDGTKIVFERITAQNPSNPFEKDTHIFTINIATREETQLTVSRGTVGSNDNTQPAWSPDGNTIAYSKFAPGCSTDYGSTYYAIDLMDTSGNSLGPLTCPPAGEYMQNAGSRPAWSPDGQEIAFVRGELSFQLYKVNVSTRAVTKLTDTPKNGYDELNPAWSPDGKNIAISSLRDGYWDIWLVDSNGSGYRTNLTNSNPDVDNFPAFER